MWYDSLTSPIEKILADKIFLEKESYWEILKKNDLSQLQKRVYTSLEMSKLSILNTFALAPSAMISKKALEPYISKTSYSLVFVNGYFQKEYSTYPSCIKIAEEKSFLSSSEEEAFLKEKKKHFFSLLNALFSLEETVVEIAPHTHLDKPLEIIHIIQEGKDQIAFPRILLHVLEGSEVTIYTKIYPIKKASVFYPEHIFIIDQDAHVQYYPIRMRLEENGESFFALLKKKAHLNLTQINIENKKNILEGNVLLLGEESSFRRKSLSVLTEKEEDHTFLKVEHLGKESVSHVHCKKILLKKSFSSFKGEIWIKPSAILSQSNQLNQNLLLSEACKACSTPEMRIFADNVKASHGATISQIQEKELFYLRSRGLNYLEAFSALVMGFCQDFIDFVPQDELKDELESKVKKILS